MRTKCGQKSKSKGCLTEPKKFPAQKLTPPPPKKKKQKQKQKKQHAKRDLVPGHRHRTRILAWVCLKKECVHISAQRVPYFDTKCERCITFPRATKEIGHVCRHAGYLLH